MNTNQELNEVGDSSPYIVKHDKSICEDSAKTCSELQTCGAYTVNSEVVNGSKNQEKGEEITFSTKSYLCENKPNQSKNENNERFQKKYENNTILIDSTQGFNESISRLKPAPTPPQRRKKIQKPVITTPKGWDFIVERKLSSSQENISEILPPLSPIKSRRFSFDGKCVRRCTSPDNESKKPTLSPIGKKSRCFDWNLGSKSDPKLVGFKSLDSMFSEQKYLNKQVELENEINSKQVNSPPDDDKNADCSLVDNIQCLPINLTRLEVCSSPNEIESDPGTPPPVPPRIQPSAPPQESSDTVTWFDNSFFTPLHSYYNSFHDSTSTKAKKMDVNNPLYFEIENCDTSEEWKNQASPPLSPISSSSTHHVPSDHLCNQASSVSFHPQSTHIQHTIVPLPHNTFQFPSYETSSHSPAFYQSNRSSPLSSPVPLPRVPHQGSPVAIPRRPHQGSPAAVPHTSHQGSPVDVPRTPHQGSSVAVPHTPHQCSPVDVPRTLYEGSPVIVPHTPRQTSPVVVPRKPHQGSPVFTRESPIVKTSRISPQTSPIPTHRLPHQGSPIRSHGSPVLQSSCVSRQTSPLPVPRLPEQGSPHQDSLHQGSLYQDSLHQGSSYQDSLHQDSPYQFPLHQGSQTHIHKSPIPPPRSFYHGTKEFLESKSHEGSPVPRHRKIQISSNSQNEQNIHQNFQQPFAAEPPKSSHQIAYQVPLRRVPIGIEETPTDSQHSESIRLPHSANSSQYFHDTNSQQFSQTNFQQLPLQSNLPAIFHQTKNQQMSHQSNIHPLSHQSNIHHSPHQSNIQQSPHQYNIQQMSLQSNIQQSPHQSNIPLSPHQSNIHQSPHQSNIPLSPHQSNIQQMSHQSNLQQMSHQSNIQQLSHQSNIQQFPYQPHSQFNYQSPTTSSPYQIPSTQGIPSSNCPSQGFPTQSFPKKSSQTNAKPPIPTPRNICKKSEGAAYGESFEELKRSSSERSLNEMVRFRVDLIDSCFL